MAQWGQWRCEGASNNEVSNGTDKTRKGGRCHWPRCRSEQPFGSWVIRVKFYDLRIRNIPEEAQYFLFLKDMFFPVTPS